VAVKFAAFQVLSISTVAALYVLIVLGGLVASTGSGLACPDWPLCQGRILPNLAPDILIEFVHRVWTIVVTALVVATMLLAWKEYRWNKVTAFSTLTFISLLGQVLLGMATVTTGTDAIVVTAHLAVATLVFASALTASVISIMYSVTEEHVK
jgi:cytochrome c oxidase assembly protein subunit 15